MAESFVFSFIGRAFGTPGALFFVPKLGSTKLVVLSLRHQMIQKPHTIMDTTKELFDGTDFETLKMLTKWIKTRPAREIKGKTIDELFRHWLANA